MDLTQYLQRINYDGSREATLEVLQQLQSHHLLYVPFENLDIHLGKKIELYKTFDKVVTNRRGGFCYDLNGCFIDCWKVSVLK